MQVPDAVQECAERDRFQAEYRDAVLRWIEMGGANANVMHLPRALSAKRDLDAAAVNLVEHRELHNC